MPGNIIFISGFPRSGTTLLQVSFQAFSNVWVSPGEKGLNYVFPPQERQRYAWLVVKMPCGGQSVAGWKKRGAEVVFVIRDPRDRISSAIGSGLIRTDNNNLIECPRLKRYHNILEKFDTIEKECKIIKYEDLCIKPNEVQEDLISTYNLTAKCSFSEVHSILTLDPRSEKTLKGADKKTPIRPIGSDSIGRWQKDNNRERIEKFVSLPAIEAFMVKFGYRKGDL